jgi:hypothetical protein
MVGMRLKPNSYFSPFFFIYLKVRIGEEKANVLFAEVLDFEMDVHKAVVLLQFKRRSQHSKNPLSCSQNFKILFPRGPRYDVELVSSTVVESRGRAWNIKDIGEKEKKKKKEKKKGKEPGEKPKSPLVLYVRNPWSV